MFLFSFISQEQKIESTLLKNDGNESFKQQKYDEAVKLYTEALNVCPLKFSQNRAVLFGNRAAAKINLVGNFMHFLNFHTVLNNMLEISIYVVILQ